MAVPQPDFLHVFNESSGTAVTNYGTAAAGFAIAQGAPPTHASWNPGVGPWDGYLQTNNVQTNLTALATTATAPSGALEAMNVALGFRVTGFDTAAGGGYLVAPAGGLGVATGNVTVLVASPAGAGDFDLTVTFRNSGDAVLTHTFSGLSFGVDYKLAASLDPTTPGATQARFKLDAAAVVEPATANWTSFGWEAAWPRLGRRADFTANYGVAGRWHYFAHDRGGSAWTAAELTAINANPKSQLTGWPGALTGPTIDTEPTNQTVTAPAQATFGVAATTSGGALSFQWQRSNDGGGTWANVTTGSGGTTASYTTAATSSAASGSGGDNGARFRCAVTDTNGTTTSASATLTVNAAGVVTISDVGDEQFYPGETGVVIAGAGFLTPQGAGKVYLSPTNNVADVNRVEQTVTGWSATSITFTAVKGGLSFDAPLFLFVVNSSSVSNASGYAVTLTPRVYVREKLIDLGGAARASNTGITAAVFHAVPTVGVPNPNQLLTGLTTDASGNTNWEIARGSLAIGAPVWVVLFKDGGTPLGSCKKVTPVYE